MTRLGFCRSRFPLVEEQRRYREPAPSTLPHNVERELFDIVAGLELKASQEARLFFSEK